MLVTPQRRRSSLVITKMAAAAADCFWGFLETEVISISMSASMLMSVRSSGSAAFAVAACVESVVSIAGSMMMPERLRNLSSEVFNRAARESGGVGLSAPRMKTSFRRPFPLLILVASCVTMLLQLVNK